MVTQRTNLDRLRSLTTNRKRSGDWAPMRRSERLAVGYLRVSTARQASEGVSLEAQRAAIEGECERRGLRLSAVFADEGVSGRRSDREGLAKALAEAKAKRAALVVYSLSRFARSTADALAMIEDLDRSKCAFVSVSENLETASACGRFTLTVLAGAAQLEAESAAERTRDALAHLRANGRRTGGSVPFGYLAEPDGRLVAHPEESQVVAAIVRLRSEGASLRGIVETLNANAIPTRGAKAWTLTQVARIVKREACPACGD